MGVAVDAFIGGQKDGGGEKQKLRLITRSRYSQTPLFVNSPAL